MPVDLIIADHRLADVELVIFDKDGTLIDVHAYWANMIRLRAHAVCKRLALDNGHLRGLMDVMGVDVQAMRIKPTGPVGLAKRAAVLQAGVDYLIAAGHDDHTALLRDAFQQIDDESAQRFNEIIHPLPGACDLARGLRANGCKVAIATTDRTERAILAMKHLGIAEEIDIVLGADKVDRPKPAPDIVLAICDELGVAVERSIIVGDAAVDLIAGRAAGCMALIGVASGLTPADELRSLTSFVVADVSGISVAGETGSPRCADGT